MLQNKRELILVEQELISIWASVKLYCLNDTAIMVYNDFLNDVLKAQTHLHFYKQTQRIISQTINGDLKYNQQKSN
jgi:hypothetical protein